MPRRSPGCEKCRARKVRCDERKPQCRRCIDYGVVCPGYRPPAHKDLQFVDQTHKVATGTTWREAEIRGGRHAELKWQAQNPAVNSRPAGVKNTYMHQLKLLGTFLSLYAPDMASTTTVSHYHALDEFPSIDLSAPLMQVAITALGCAEIGTLHNNERWIQEARSHYANALPMLAKELGKPARQRMRDDLILAVIVIFALCELFDKLTLERGRAVGWFFHLHGALHHMRSKQDGALSTPLGELLFHHIRHNSACLGAIQRKPVALAAPEWLDYTKNKSAGDSYIALYDIVVHIPGVLEKVDLCLSSEPRSEARELVDQLCDHREKLERWLLKWHGPRNKSTAYDVVDIREMAQFSNLVEDRTFVTVFRFKSAGTCSQMQVFNHFCSLCDIDILRLLDGPLVATAPTTQYGTSERRKEDIERDVLVAATSYCRGLPYCYEPGTGSLGRMGPLVLRILQDYFEAKGHDRELGWCLESKRMRQKAADERSAALKRSQEESTQVLSHRDVPVVRYDSSGIYKEDGKVKPFEGLLV